MLDLIDRSEAMELLEKAEQNPANTLHEMCLLFTDKFLKKRPTVEATLVTYAHWEELSNPVYMNKILFRCSKCRKVIQRSRKYNPDPIGEDFRYCPRCGARMNQSTERVESRSQLEGTQCSD